MAQSSIQNEIKLTALSAKCYFQTKAKESIHVTDLSEAIENTLQKSSKIIKEQNRQIDQLNQIIKNQRQEIAEMKKIKNKSEFQRQRSSQKSSTMASTPPKSRHLLTHLPQIKQVLNNLPHQRKHHNRLPRPPVMTSKRSSWTATVMSY